MWTAALVLNILHLTYHQLTTNFDFFPFNNIRNYTLKQRIAEVLVNLVTMGFPVVALIMDNHRMVGAARWFLGFLLCGELWSWWKAYFFGGSEEWKRIYTKIHKETIIVLPPIKDHPIPNLEHCILHGLTLASLIATIIYYYQ